MIYCFMGASCTGKTTIVQELQTKYNLKVYNGKDYLRLAKNPAEAETAFKETLIVCLFKIPDL